MPFSFPDEDVLSRTDSDRLTHPIERVSLAPLGLAFKLEWGEPVSQ
jgi:hypothetical protein